MVLIISLVLNIGIYASADSIILNESVDLSNYEKFVVPETRANTTYIDSAIEFVKFLDLEGRGFVGLEEKNVADLYELKDNGHEISNYAIYLPKGSTEVYYGTYNSCRIMSSFTVYDDAYTYTMKSNDIDRWVNGLINVGMNYVTKWISVPYSIISSFGTENTNYTGKYLQMNIKDELTNRYLSVQDIGNGNPNKYITTFRDQSRVPTAQMHIFFSSPFINDAVKTVVDRVSVYSANWTNKNSNMKVAYDAYNRYVLSGGSLSMVDHLLPRCDLKYK